MTQTCHTWGTGGRVGYPPPGSRLCPAHGGAQIEPGGWSDLNPHPCTPLLVTIAATYVLGNRPGKFGPPWGGGWGFPVPPTHAVLDLTVRQQRPRCDLNSALRAVHPPPLSLLKGFTCPRCMPLVRFHRHTARRVAWLALSSPLRKRLSLGTGC